MSCYEASSEICKTHPNSKAISTSEESKRRPELPITIHNLCFDALLDSGASVSAICEQTFESVKNNTPKDKVLAVLPVTGVTISTAVRGRSRKVTTQVLLPVKVFGHITDGIFLVVPHLATPIILGDDWLTQHKVRLDYGSRVTHFPQWNISVPFTVRPNEICQPDCRMLSVSSNIEEYSRSIPDQCIASVEQISQHLHHSLSSTMSIYSCNTDPDVYIDSYENIRERILSISHLSEEQSHRLLDLLIDYHPIFRKRPGLNTLYTCRFDVVEEIPFKVKPYPVPFARRPAVEQELQRMLDWGVIERCSSPYSSPIICVSKADGSVRLCLDARRINKIILPMRDSSPPLDELLAKFGGKSIFTSLDFTAGYWQVPLHRDVRKFTAFVYNGRTYQFCVVPFGLNISNTAFGLALEAVLNVKVDEEDDIDLDDLHMYVDDLMISTTSFDDHIHRLRVLFQKIKLSGMTLKFGKCEFICTQIKFLGHIITPKGMIMDPSKLRAIHEFPMPRNKKDLQSFVGFCNFYRKFSDHHSALISPLIDHLKKDAKWCFGETERQLFDAVKSTFSEHILSHPDFTKGFNVQTDASKLGLGAELFQVNEKGDRLTISFASRTLNSAERNYSITELELLSIVFACEKFRMFILGYPVTIITDHQALVFLQRCRLRNARLTRWTLLLQEFNLQIEYIPDPKNIIDTLSRHPIGRDNIPQQDNPPCIYWATPKSLLAECKNRLESFQHIVQEQNKDPELAKIMNLLSEETVPIPVKQRYYLYQGTLFYRRYVTSDTWLVCIPLHRREELIQSFHEHFGDVGPKKCITVMRDVCYFRGLSKHVRRIVRSCDLCQRSKHSTVRTEGKMQHVMADYPLARVCVDIYGPLPPGWNQVCYIYIFVVLDSFSRFVRLYAIKRSTAKTVTNRMVDDYISTYGIPKSVISDHGVQFVSKIWKKRLSEAGVTPTTTSVYHPQSNPVERVMRELGRLFRTYCHDHHTNWPRYVNYMEWVINHVIHEATGFTPYELFLGNDRYNPVREVVQFPPFVQANFNTKLTMANEEQRTKAEERRLRHARGGKSTIFIIGEKVLVRTHRLSSSVDRCISKFFLLYEGPYVVTEIKNINAYVVNYIDSGKIRGTYNVVFLRKYITPERACQHDQE